MLSELTIKGFHDEGQTLEQVKDLGWSFIRLFTGRSIEKKEYKIGYVDDRGNFYEGINTSKLLGSVDQQIIATRLPIVVNDLYPIRLVRRIFTAKR
jgi:hypothetical protein